MSLATPSLVERLVVAIVALVLLGAYLDPVVVRLVQALQPDPVERAQQEYVDGRISLRQLEREVAYHVDDRNERIERVVERVNGIDEVRREAIARQFDSLAALEAASLAELQEVNDIGPSRAQAIRDYLDDGLPDTVADRDRALREVEP